MAEVLVRGQWSECFDIRLEVGASRSVVGAKKEMPNAEKMSTFRLLLVAFSRRVSIVRYIKVFKKQKALS